jgi:tetratricopeptide (TPR) repeat protein/MFS family permease
MSKSRGFILIFVPAATVFFSSAFIMILEIVAGRLIAKHVGSSLYTWTSVIGVVLAGISVGNYLGGRIADRFAAKKALAVLFAISSVACVVVVVANNLVGEWQFLWQFSLPVRIFSHTSLVFLVPSTLLGMISPVVAKMALDQGLSAGRTVGDIYAWGAAGSIVGTLLAGFYLIATMGTVAIIWTVAAALLLMSILYWAGLRVLYVWAAIFVVLMTMAAVPSKWAENLGSSLALRKQPDPSILYEDESQYSDIIVQQLSSSPDERKFSWNGIHTHAYNRIVMNDITNLKGFYMQIYAAVTRRLSQDKGKLSVLAIGGGGYVFPRYVEYVWPGSRIDVVEIDPAVTEAAMQAFGLPRDSEINTFNMDARNYVDELLKRQRRGKQIPRYDFIYEDAFDGYSIPFQLVTKEFNDRIARILADDGVYMINLIDIYETGSFLCSLVNTIQRTFPSVYVVVSKRLPPNMGGNVVIIAAKQKINLDNLDTEEPVKNLDLRVLDSSEVNAMRERAQGVVLTDNYAPVENLLAPAVLEMAVRSQAMEYLEQAENLRTEGKWDESILKYKAAVSVYPPFSIAAYDGMGQVFANQGRWEKAISAAKSALEYNAKAEIKQSMSIFYNNIGFALKKLGRNDEASQYINKAIEGYREDLSKEPDSVETVRRLGNILAENGDFSEATKYFLQAVNMAPYDVENHSLLVKALVVQGRYDEAIEQLYKGVRLMRDNGQEDDAVTLERLLKSVESRKSEIK